jgi:heavy metal-binding protein
MKTRAASVVWTALVLAGCATTTPPPRFASTSPADAEAPEAATPPPALVLSGEPDANVREPAATTAPPSAGHESHQGHSMPAQDPQQAVYSCRMHPEVKQATPGTCPKCGMPLALRPKP